MLPSGRRSGRPGRLARVAILVVSPLTLACNRPGATRLQHELGISSPDSAVVRLSSGDLRRHRSSTSLEISDAPGYEGTTLTFRVVPMSDLFPARYDRPEFNVVFECLDGFTASIPATRLLGGSADGLQAFLAIEDPDSPWPSLKNRPGASAGPFFLIWKAERSRRPGPEEWPYQIKSIAVRHAQEEFRGIIPETGPAVEAAVVAGFQVFVRNCSPCHTLNGVGDGHLGPDLNMPMSPTEYFQEDVFRRYVRSPGSVLNWPGQRMPSFPADVVPDAELSDLHAYLAYMARRKSAASPRNEGK